MVCEEFLSTSWVAKGCFGKGGTARWELRQIVLTLWTGFYTSFWTCAERYSIANWIVSRYQVLQAGSQAWLEMIGSNTAFLHPLGYRKVFNQNA